MAGYIGDDAEDWKEKSSSKSYRKVYDRLGNRLAKNKGVFVDFGTGTGELLKRAARKNFEVIVGTDISDEMLSMAKENLSEYGLPVNIVSTYKEVGGKGIYLMKDDMFDSSLPEGIADVVSNMFPNWTGYHPALKDDDYMRFGAYAEEFSLDPEHLPFSDSVIRSIVIELRRYDMFLRTLKDGGDLHFAEFASVSTNSRSEHYHVQRLEADRRILKLFDLIVEGTKFYEDPVVYSDLEKSKSVKIAPGEDRVGYRITHCVKQE